jgi:dTDP-L-rhamnose 4-epimerase
MKVLITGGAGFIGSSLALSLAAKGHSVTVLDNLLAQIHGDKPDASPVIASITKNCKLIRGDVLDRVTCVQALEGQEAVVHLAAETGTGQSMYEIARYVNVNVAGTALLLDTLLNIKNRVERVVVASSRAIYGEGKYTCPEHGIIFPGPRRVEDLEKRVFEHQCPRCGTILSLLATDEESIIQPTSIYGITKHTQEQLVLAFGAMTGIPTSALRFQNVYGPGQSLKNPYTGILSIFSTSLLQGNPIDVYEDGLESRDFVFIDDVVSSVEKILFLESPWSGAVNVGSGVPISIRKVAETLKNVYHSSSEIRITGRSRKGDIRHNFADLSLAKRLMDYEPKIAFGDGVKEYASWVKTQKIEHDNYLDSVKELTQRGLYK